MKATVCDWPECHEYAVLSHKVLPDSADWGGTLYDACEDHAEKPLTAWIAVWERNLHKEGEVPA